LVTFNLANHIRGETTLIQVGGKNCQKFVSNGLTIITLSGASERKLQKISRLWNLIQRISENIDLIAPDIVILEGASWVFYHWLLLRRIRHSQPQIKVIYHAHNVEYLLRKEKHNSLVVLITKWAEGQILRNIDLSFAVSEVDALHFEELYRSRPKLLPNGIDVNRFDQTTQTEVETSKSMYGIGKNIILFLGSYLYKPNQEGIDFLVQSVMPRVVQQCPHAKLAIIGGDVPYKRPWLINPGIIPYEHLPAFVKACKIGVAPVFSGSGTRLKILEYMTAGIPVVSTHKGAEGLHVQNGWNILLADREPDFSTEICKLLSDSQLSAAFGKRGREVVDNHYSWKTIMNNWHDVLYAWQPQTAH